MTQFLLKETLATSFLVLLCVSGMAFTQSLLADVDSVARRMTSRSRAFLAVWVLTIVASGTLLALNA
jgi:hypothetical protein